MLTERRVHVHATPRNMDWDGQLMQVQLESSPMAVDEYRQFSEGCMNGDFDVGQYERDEEEQHEEAMICAEVSSDSDSSDGKGGRYVPVQDTILRDVLGSSHVPDAMGVPTHLEDGTPYDSWVRLSEAQSFMPPEPYTEIELMQLRSVNIPFSGVPNSRDISMTDMAVCDTGL